MQADAALRTLSAKVNVRVNETGHDEHAGRINRFVGFRFRKDLAGDRSADDPQIADFILPLPRSDQPSAFDE